MSNTLIKDTQVSYTPGSPGVPASPGSPGSPAHTSYETQTVCGWQPVNGQTGHYTYVQGADGTWQYIFVPDATPPPGGYTTSAYQYVCLQMTVPVYYPAVAPTAPTPGVDPVPAQTTYDYNLGWNSGARSIHFFTGNGYAQWAMPRSVVGAVVGLNDADPDARFDNIDFGFMFSDGLARVYENGAEVHYVGAYADGDVFRIERRSGTVRYYQGGSLVYTSAVASLPALFLDASLYSGGDQVNSPSIGDLADVSLQLAPLTVNGGNVAFAQAALQFQPLTVSSHPFSGANLTFKGLAVLGGKLGAAGSYGQAALTFEALTLDARPGLPAPPYALASLALAPLALAAHGYTGTVGGANLSFKPLIGLGSDRVYGEARLSFEPLVTYASAYEGNGNASLAGFALGSAALAGQAQLVVVMNQHGTITNVLSVAMARDAAMSDGASLADSLALGSVLYALLPASATLDAYVPVLGGVAVNQPATVTGTVTGTGTGTSTVAVTGTVTGSGTSTGSGTLTGTLTLTSGTVTGAVTGTVTGTVGADGSFTGTFTGTDAAGHVITGTVVGTVVGDVLGPPVDGVNTAWVVNWDSRASMRYENYDFTSYATIGGRHYGVKADGIYLLEGDTDDGDPIRASLGLGRQDFDSRQRKRVPYCYIGMSSTGTMYLRVTAAGQTYTYQARRADAEMRMQRVDLGKGLAANYFEFELYNHSGSDFELDTVDFQYAEMTRRI